MTAAFCAQNFFFLEMLVPRYLTKWSFIKWAPEKTVYSSGSGWSMGINTNQHSHASPRWKAADVAIYLLKSVNKLWGRGEWDVNAGTRDASEIFPIDFYACA